MSKNFLHYWKPSTAVAEADTKVLNHSASNQFKRVSEGDTVWLVTVRDCSLELIGKIKISFVCNQQEAANYLEVEPDELWEASHHIIAEGEGLSPVFVEIQKVATKLRFISSTGKSTLALVDGKVNPGQLQTMRELSKESVEMLEQIFKDNYRKIEDEDQEEEETGERCPFCKTWNNWGEMDTCEHHIGVVFDGGIVESDIGQELGKVWSSLADKIDVMEEMGEAALIEKSKAEHQVVQLVLKKCSYDTVGFPALESVFNIQQGDLTIEDEGMLGGSVYSLFVENPTELEGKVAQLKLIDAAIPD